MLGNISVNRTAYHHITNTTRDVSVVRPENTQTDDSSQSSDQNRSRKVGQAFDISDSERHNERGRNRASSNSLDAYQTIIQQHRGQTVLFRMMETMGGTGTHESQSGMYLDTYV